MPTLPWNEIRQRAISFSREWSDVCRERAESQTFWNHFFSVFGLSRKAFASFEEPVKNLKGKYDYIDVFWRGRVLGEHKSAGKPLDKAASQAFHYIQELASSGRHEEIPRYVIVSDFQNIVLYDLEPDEQLDLPLFQGIHVVECAFPLSDLHKHIRLFAFMAGYKVQRQHEEDPANLEAAGIMAGLHDELRELGYTGADLERFLVRLLFCLFAEDTGIFEPSQFGTYIRNHSREDGSDLGLVLSGLFQVLDTPPEKRMKNIEEDLSAFPYIDGALFREAIRIPSFSRTMREKLLGASERFKWEKISPAVFGSLFQGVMDAKERRSIGAHYTSERDILKLIGPLFLDRLHEEFDAIRQDRSTRREQRLLDFQKKLASLRFLDPACGCGNFLVIAYRELRRLELEVLRLRYKLDAKEAVQELPYGEVAKLSLVDVDQFYGIEIEEWPARIAETALWLMDHQMNVELSAAVGNIFQRIPLRKAPQIRCANALRFDWNDLLPARECSYVLGNPPFIGKQYQTAEQKADMEAIWGGVKGSGVLDYVTCWYVKAAVYSKENSAIAFAFVSTNSITQGEQVLILWRHLLHLGLRINFAHRTFAWQSEAKGKAHVHVVIIGAALWDAPNKVIFDYENLKGDSRRTTAVQINPYLVDAPLTLIDKRRQTICAVPHMNFGSMPNDGGHLLLLPSERTALLHKEPELAPYVRRLVGSREFLNGEERYCLWLVKAPPSLLRRSEEIVKRAGQVRQHRLSSDRKSTVELAAIPTRFGEIRQSSTPYIAIPEVSSERRTYVPIGFLDASVIATNKIYQIPSAGLYEFGILQSSMHMGWIRQVAGRLKSDFQYSAGLVYNNFPWPMDATQAQKDAVAEKAQAVLDARKPFLAEGSTLADLYDPLTMPADLLKAHQSLDKAVDRCYRREAFESERQRVEFLFQLYGKITAPLAVVEKPKCRRGRAVAE
jgi:hypothetical protein